MSTIELIGQKLANLPQAAQHEYLSYLEYLEFKYAHQNEASTDGQQFQWQQWYNNLSQFTDDFMAERHQPKFFEKRA